MWVVLHIYANNTLTNVLSPSLEQRWLMATLCFSWKRWHSQSPTLPGLSTLSILHAYWLTAVDEINPLSLVHTCRPPEVCKSFFIHAYRPSHLNLFCLGVAMFFRVQAGLRWHSDEGLNITRPVCHWNNSPAPLYSFHTDSRQARWAAEGERQISHLLWE